MNWFDHPFKGGMSNLIQYKLFEIDIYLNIVICTLFHLFFRGINQNKKWINNFSPKCEFPWFVLKT